MGEKGVVMRGEEGYFEWIVGTFRSLPENQTYWSPKLIFGGINWRLGLEKLPKECIILDLRRGSGGPPIIDIEYTLTVELGDESKEVLRNRNTFERMEESPRVIIKLGDLKMPSDGTLTICCDFNCSLDEEDELKERLQQKTAELAEKQSELVRLQRLNEELNLKVIDLENSRDNAQKSLKINNTEDTFSDVRLSNIMGEKGTVVICGTEGGCFEWIVGTFRSLPVNQTYWSPKLIFRGINWRLGLEKLPKECVLLDLRRDSGGPPTIDIEYKLTVELEDESKEVLRNRKVFKRMEESPRVVIKLCGLKMPRGGILIIRCFFKCSVDKEEQKTAELAEKQSELARLQRLNEELYIKVIGLETNRDNVQKLLEAEIQLKEKLEEKTAELESKLVRLQYLNQVLNLKVIDLENSRDNAQTSLGTEKKTPTVDDESEAAIEPESSGFSETDVSSECEKSVETSTADNVEDNELEVTAATESESSGFSETEREKSASIVGDPEEYDFTEDFTCFLEERRGTDVTFVAETLNEREEIFAHRLVLAMRSPYFADEFYGEQRCKEAIVVILKNVDQKLFKDMMRYCYGWEPCLKTTEETCALLDVAARFKVAGLANACRTFLRNAEIEPGNVFSLMVISEKSEDKTLRDRCNELLQDKTEEVMKFFELCDVTPSMVRAILDLSKLSLCSEFELIKWILEWAKVKSGEKDSNCKNAREYLENNLLKYMNFLALTFEEFVTLCNNNPGFFSPAEFQSISMNIASPGAAEMPDWFDKDCRFRVYAGTKRIRQFYL